MARRADEALLNGLRWQDQQQFAVHSLCWLVVLLMSMMKSVQVA
jgi:hypothetical protein